MPTERTAIMAQAIAQVMASPDIAELPYPVEQAAAWVDGITKWDVALAMDPQEAANAIAARIERRIFDTMVKGIRFAGW